MKLSDLGFNNNLEKFRTENNLMNFATGRIVAEHKERYTVKTEHQEYEAEITGHLRFTARSREDFPAVGDWVAMTTFDNNLAIIHQIYPRFSLIKRQAVDQYGEVQIIATNINYAFIVQAADRDYNINRLERYLTICNASKVSPIILLNKIDLITELQLTEMIAQIKVRIKNIPVFGISSESNQGYDLIKTLLKKGKTYCLLGSSGVGKSTIVNCLSEKAIMRTDAISQTTNKGRHITSHRELILLKNGGILIDNPGMREVGITDSANGLDITFNRIVNLSKNCRFKDCTHTNEIGCLVLEAIEKGEIEESFYENYIKMTREQEYFESTVAERRKKDKEFGKFLKNYKKDKQKNKY